MEDFIDDRFALTCARSFPNKILLRVRRRTRKKIVSGAKFYLSLVRPHIGFNSYYSIHFFWKGAANAASLALLEIRVPIYGARRHVSRTIQQGEEKAVHTPPSSSPSQRLVSYMPAAGRCATAQPSPGRSPPTHWAPSSASMSISVCVGHGPPNCKNTYRYL
jgi:hypothetical protein